MPFGHSLEGGASEAEEKKVGIRSPGEQPAFVGFVGGKRGVCTGPTLCRSGGAIPRVSPGGGEHRPSLLMSSLLTTPSHLQDIFYVGNNPLMLQNI